jgi:spore germination protein KA/spore germination protein
MRLSKSEGILKSLEAEGFSFTKRMIPFDDGTIHILYIQHLTDRPSLSELVVKPLAQHFHRRTSGLQMLRAREVMDNILYADDCDLESDAGMVRDLILGGKTVILLSWDDDYIVVNLKKVEHRAVSEPQIEYTLRGPRDCFVESLNVNLSLIRYRVKDPKLRVKHYKLGRRTKTDVAVFYIEDIANESVVSTIQRRIEAIDIDSIVESGELEIFLQKSKWSLFPQLGVVERSDMACHLLSEGKVLILVDGSGLALSAPKVFAEYFHSCDDRYDNPYFGLMTRLMRYVSLFFVLTASSYFVAISSFHIDALPSQYTLDLAQMRTKVPLPPILSALLLEFILELLREALLRVPKQIGSAVGIVSAIVIGQAAIAAGIFSPLLLIIVSAALLASFAMPDYTLINPFRILKLGALLSTSIFGFYGLILFLCLLLAHLVSMDSFGVPYLAPFAPFNLYDFLRTLMFNISFSPLRHKYNRDKDNERS